jgi:hypothetical protein
MVRCPHVSCTDHDRLDSRFPSLYESYLGHEFIQCSGSFGECLEILGTICQAKDEGG